MWKNLEHNKVQLSYIAPQVTWGFFYCTVSARRHTHPCNRSEKKNLTRDPWLADDVSAIFIVRCWVGSNAILRFVNAIQQRNFLVVPEKKKCLAQGHVDRLYVWYVEAVLMCYRRRDKRTMASPLSLAEKKLERNRHASTETAVSRKSCRPLRIPEPPRKH